MSARSAGLLLYRVVAGSPQVLLVHPGGPFFARRDDGWWTVPKGLIEEGEDELAAAYREFEEELGFSAPVADAPLDLGTVRQRGGKLVHAFAVEGDCDSTAARSNTFRLEWPPRSGRFREFPEVDRAEFFSLETARRKINPAQVPFLVRLLEALAGR